MTDRYQESTYTPPLPHILPSSRRASQASHHSHSQSQPQETTTQQQNTQPRNHKWYSFLLPAEYVQASTRIYDVPLRQGLFHRAKAGNEETSGARRASVESQTSQARRSSSVFTDGVNARPALN